MLKRLLLGLIFVFITATPTKAIDGFITVNSPTSGTYTEGETVNVTWDTSPNIDKISIMYKSDPYHGNWIAFNTANTKSYSWKVDVGNTTNTQFYIEIIGYETGQGSLTASGGTFTVNQNPPLNTGSTTTTTTTNQASPTASPTSLYPYRPLTSPSPTPTATPKPITPRLTVTTLLLWSEFTFEGSKTTNLKDIADPKNVENFTLDTQEGFTFIFRETLDLTDQKTLAALQNTKDYWEFEMWYVWIEWEWWIKYDITETIEVEYKNESLTAYAPTIETTTPLPSPAAAKTKSAATHKPPTVLGAETGKVKLALNDGTPVKIKPRVELDNPKSPIGTPKTKLTGQTSHSNLSWTLEQNGFKTNVSPVISSESGEFGIAVEGLTEGENTFRLSYTEPGGETVTLEPISISYDPSIWSRYGSIILTGLALLTAFVAGILLPRWLPLTKVKKKLLKKKR